MGWVTEHAPTPAELDACVSCGLCLPACPTFRLTGEESASPRGRLAAMSAVADGIIEVDETFEDVIGFCLGCRACEVVCPALVPYGRALEGARAEITAQRPTAGRTTRHGLVGKALGSRTTMRVASVAAAAAQRLHIDRIAPGPLARMRGMRPLPLTSTSISGTTHHAIGPIQGTVALLAGCVMDPWFGDVHTATIGLLTRAGYRVEVPKSQTCCGALAAHDGDAADAERLAKQNLEAFAGYDIVIANAAGCSAHLKGYDHWGDNEGSVSGAARDITEFIADLIDQGMLPTLMDDRGPVAVQDPCHLRHAQRIVDAPRQILRAAGHTPIDIDPAGMCCGAAGIYMVLHPDTSDELGAIKADQIVATGGNVVASANPGCEMQLRSQLADGYRVAHPVELYFEALTNGVSHG